MKCFFRLSSIFDQYSTNFQRPSSASDPLLGVKTEVEQAGGVVQKSDSLLLLSLFGHLVSKVGQLAGERLDQLLSCLQLKKIGVWSGYWLPVGLKSPY